MVRSVLNPSNLDCTSKLSRPAYGSNIGAGLEWKEDGLKMVGTFHCGDNTEICQNFAVTSKNEPLCLP